MGKIGILTLNGYHNYGNRLQNYALQKVLESLGFDVDTIIVNLESNINKDKSNANTIQKLKAHTPKEVLHKICFKVWRILNKSKIKGYQKKREEIFKKFTEEYIVETSYSISDKRYSCRLIY